MARIPCQFRSRLRKQPDLAPASYRTTPAVVQGGNVVSAQGVVEMSLNPRSITWQEPKRITPVYTRGGPKFFHFTDDAGRNNDVLTLRFEGSTGNIARDFTTQPTFDLATMPPENAARLQTWLNLYQLTREPVLLADGSFNWQYIRFTSLTVPVPIELQGHYESVLEWTEDASDASRARYSFSFVVSQQSANEVDALLSGLRLSNDNLPNVSGLA